MDTSLYDYLQAKLFELGLLLSYLPLFQGSISPISWRLVEVHTDYSYLPFPLSSITKFQYMFLLTHYVQFEIGQKKASFYILYNAVICIATEGTALREAAIHVFLYPENS